MIFKLAKMPSLQDKISSAVLRRIRQRQIRPPADEKPQSSVPLPPARLREARFSDFPAVARLKERTGIVADSIENWNRLWRDNPALQHGSREHPMGWVLETANDIVGYFGNIPLECHYRGKALKAVTAHGFAVDHAYRALAISLASAFYRQKSVDLFLSTSAVESSGRIALAFKCAALPYADYDTVLFWVLRPYSFAQVLMRKLKAPPIVSSFGSVVTSIVIGVDRLLRHRRFKQSPTTLKIREKGLPSVGDEFEALWREKLKERFRLYADRAPATVRWHFDIPGDRGVARVLCCYGSEKLVGYAVVRTDFSEEDGLKKSIIADLLASNDDPEIVRALLASAYEYASAAGSHVLEFQGFPAAIREVASQARPYSRKLPACPYYYKASDPELQLALSNAEAWYACPFDGDATLIRASQPGLSLSVDAEPSKAMGAALCVADGEPEQPRAF